MVTFMNVMGGLVSDIDNWSTNSSSLQPQAIHVTVPDKRDHFRQYFKIELLVLKGRVALKQ